MRVFSFFFVVCAALSFGAATCEPPVELEEGCTDDAGIFHPLGSTYPAVDGCNTCTCTEGGQGCTKIGCRPTCATTECAEGWSCEESDDGPLCVAGNSCRNVRCAAGRKCVDWLVEDAPPVNQPFCLPRCETLEEVLDNDQCEATCREDLCPEGFFCAVDIFFDDDRPIEAARCLPLLSCRNVRCAPDHGCEMTVLNAPQCIPEGVSDGVSDGTAAPN